MSKEKARQPSLDPLMEGYLDYLADVARKAPGTVRDVRCTLHRVGDAMQSLVPDRPLWKLDLLDFFSSCLFGPCYGADIMYSLPR